jgi:hypothetical protein
MKVPPVDGDYVLIVKLSEVYFDMPSMKVRAYILRLHRDTCRYSTYCSTTNIKYCHMSMCIIWPAAGASLWMNTCRSK